MSPLQAMERSYAALKAQLRDGIYRPGHRLEANRIADELGISMTPVRDALNRLVGEELVEASTGEGFHVPRLSEGDLRDLYEWNSAIAILAARSARTIPDPEAVHAAMSSDTLADATATCFQLLAGSVPNQELRIAISRAADRLHPFRLIEAQVLEPVLGELEALLEPAERRQAAIRRYHQIRMRVAPELVRLRTGK
ncbi:GntR family transcriptional regulator [Sphingomonas sp.]|jgi:DNA-binding GntR family transcriptional regulator|uniref:GntR family transcriptional regulator n=1 Tax=Sphingomonas sp. TaxID=28214 RepID=UPI002EDB832B